MEHAFYKIALLHSLKLSEWLKTNFGLQICPLKDEQYTSCMHACVWSVKKKKSTKKTSVQFSVWSTVFELIGSHCNSLPSACIHKNKSEQKCAICYYSDCSVHQAPSPRCGMSTCQHHLMLQVSQLTALLAAFWGTAHGLAQDQWSQEILATTDSIDVILYGITIGFLKKCR